MNGLFRIPLWAHPGQFLQTQFKQVAQEWAAVLGTRVWPDRILLPDSLDLSVSRHWGFLHTDLASIQANLCPINDVVLSPLKKIIWMFDGIIMVAVYRKVWPWALCMLDLWLCAMMLGRCYQCHQNLAEIRFTSGSFSVQVPSFLHCATLCPLVRCKGICWCTRKFTGTCVVTQVRKEWWWISPPEKEGMSTSDQVMQYRNLFCR